MQYRFELKNEKSGNYRMISQLLVIINLLGFIILLFNREDKIINNIWLLLAILPATGYAILSLVKWVTNKPMAAFWHRTIFGFCALAWLKEGYWGFSILLVLFAGVDYLIQRRRVIIITEKKIIIPAIIEKIVEWSALNNIIIRDGLITIDFKNNKIIQQPVLRTGEDINEREFNEFCKSRLEEEERC
jgi:hypothetical protein